MQEKQAKPTKPTKTLNKKEYISQYKLLVFNYLS